MINTMKASEDTKYIYEDGIGRVQLVDAMGSDCTVVNAARVSFGNDSCVNIEEKDDKLIAYLANNGHTSPFEHCTVTFKCVVPLFVARQHMRHRTFSYNEISRRYTSKDIQFYCPTTFRHQAKDNRQASVESDIDPIISGHTLGLGLTSEELRTHSRLSLKLYNQMLAAGICREQARMVLPQNMYTEYYVTGNLHNMAKFVNMRQAKDSQFEMQSLALAMGDFLFRLYPASASYLVD